MDARVIKIPPTLSRFFKQDYVIMKMMSKPRPPKCSKKFVHASVYSGSDLKSFMEMYDLTLEQINFSHVDEGYMVSHVEASAYITLDKDYETRWARYQDRLSEYNIWYEKNKEEIEKEKIRVRNDKLKKKKAIKLLEKKLKELKGS